MAQPVIATALATVQLGGRLPHAIRGTINGFWLGVLSDDALRDLDERRHSVDVFADAAWNERGLMDWERAAVEQLFAPGARLLVVACGGGREVLALITAGYDAYGCEAHPALCAAADRLLAARGHPGRIEPAARDEVPAGPACDGLVIGWGAYSLIGGSDARVAFLAGARRRLGNSGRVLLSCFGHDAPGRELRWTARFANMLRRGGTVELGDTLAPNRVRIFTRTELAAEAEAAGLTLTGWELLGTADGATRYTVAALETR